MKKDKSTSLAERIKFFDFYKDLPQDLAEPSVSGATGKFKQSQQTLVSMFVMGLMVALFISQTYQFMQYQKTSEIMIDVNQGNSKLNINLAIRMHKAPCHVLSLDIVDVTGVHVMDVGGKLHKHIIDKEGIYVEHHDTMEDSHEFKQTSQDVNDIVNEAIESMNNEEGCLVEGTVIINKVPGNFHLSTHAFGEVVQRLYMQGRRLDFSHTIQHLSFGNDTDMANIMQKYEEKYTFDLDGTSINQEQQIYNGQLLANYYLDINQIDFLDVTGFWSSVLEGYKYKSSQSIMSQMGLPAIFFRYELSPVKLRYTMSYKTWSEFFIEICAIIGGMFVVAGIMESLLRNSLSIFSSDNLKKK
ncbi:UNKNOWN [Stylonychia lemnae]|uniref:Uncharacterized protein n=1 Tax=Stylonychia lemnae TaxID=5949 RepID=A0A077ZRX7_STYLE|nr:UNKNOWN [Stylonychia lemnae]|eukprot:CDW72632.1 UNKNOWN [Stylonychia lemnae]